MACQRILLYSLIIFTLGRLEAEGPVGPCPHLEFAGIVKITEPEINNLLKLLLIMNDQKRNRGARKTVLFTSLVEL